MDLRTHARIARPTLQVAAAEAFWVGGVGLEVLWRQEAGPSTPTELVMLGYPGAGWHLELARDREHPVPPTPTERDLLVLYLGAEVDDRLVTRIERHGGLRVGAAHPCLDSRDVTFADPDGYRLVLCARPWG